MLHGNERWPGREAVAGEPAIRGLGFGGAEFRVVVLGFDFLVSGLSLRFGVWGLREFGVLALLILQPVTL